MNGYERKLQILDLTVSILLFVVGYIIGKLVMNVYDSWISFNRPAIGIVLLGELLWMKIIRRAMVKKYEKSKKGD